MISNDFIYNVSVTVPAHRSASPYRLSQGKFTDRREGLHEGRSSGTQACHVSVRPLNKESIREMQSIRNEYKEAPDVLILSRQRFAGLCVY